VYNCPFTTKYVAPEQLWEANMRIAGNKMASASARKGFSSRQRAYIHQGKYSYCGVIPDKQGERNGKPEVTRGRKIHGLTTRQRDCRNTFENVQ